MSAVRRLLAAVVCVTLLALGVRLALRDRDAGSAASLEAHEALQATRTEAQPGAPPTRAEHATPLARVAHTDAALCRLAGLVRRLGTGEPVAAASVALVFVHDGVERTAPARIDGAGYAIELPRGAVVRAARIEPPPAWNDVALVPTTDELGDVALDEDREVNVWIDFDYVVEGTVIDAASGAAVPNALVRAREPTETHATASGFVLSERFEPQATARSDAAGRFRVTWRHSVDRLEGWELDFEHDRHRPAARSVVLDAERPTVAGLVVALEPAVRIGGRVVDASGAGVAYLRLYALAGGAPLEGGGRRLAWWAQASTDADGRFDFPPQVADADGEIWIPTQEHVPGVRSVGHDWRDDAREIVVRLPPSVTFVFRGTLPDGRAVQGSELNVRFEGADGSRVSFGGGRIAGTVGVEHRFDALSSGPPDVAGALRGAGVALAAAVTDAPVEVAVVLEPIELAPIYVENLRGGTLTTYGAVLEIALVDLALGARVDDWTTALAPVPPIWGWIPTGGGRTIELEHRVRRLLRFEAPGFRPISLELDMLERRRRLELELAR